MLKAPKYLLAIKMQVKKMATRQIILNAYEIRESKDHRNLTKLQFEACRTAP